MSDKNKLPETFSPMGAEFKKPYMEFEFEGEIFRLENLKGGHNGRTAKACKANPPVWDEEKQRWVVKIENNLIDIDLESQSEASKSIPGNKSFLKKMKITSNPRRSYKSIGYLISTTRNKEEPPSYPIDCEFYMYIRVKVPGKPSLINMKPFKLMANGLEEWPPRVGTVYTHDDHVELYPEWIPFATYFMKPIVRILPGDETILTEVFQLDDHNIERQGFFSSIINWLT